MSSGQGKENRRYYLRIGRCPRCGGKNLLRAGRALCEECAKKHDDRQNETRQQWREAGLCVRCGGERDGWQKLCAKCRAYADGIRKTSAKKDKKWRDEMRAKGFCTHCGKTWAEPGHSYCKKCLEKHKQYCRKPEYREKAKARRQAKIEAGLCIDCGAPTRNGKSRCQRCIEMRKDSNRKYRIIQKIEREAEKARRRTI